MKKLLLPIFLLLLLTNCEKPGDCIKSAGPMASKVFDGLTFSRLMVKKGIGVVLRQGDVTTVEVRTGENLINDIEVKLSGDMLSLEDNTTCNWTRDYGETTVYISVPNLTDIFLKSEKDITSDGVLIFPTLHLISMDPNDGFPGVGTGDFILNLRCDNSLTIDNNDVSRFFLSGTANEMHVNFYESGGILHGEDLVAHTVEVYHRGTNDMIVHPVDKINGDIYNIGNVISVNRPPIVEVTQHYNGRLIFY